MQAENFEKIARPTGDEARGTKMNPPDDRPMRMMNVRAALDEAAARLDAEGIENPRRNAEWMLGAVLGLGRASLYAQADAALTDTDLRAFETMVARRLRHEPLQYVIGHTSFFGLEIRVTPAVLIPRPETEQVVETALHLLRGVEAPRVLDVGTGSGCIALAVKSERSDATVYACDISTAALEVARANAEENDLEVTFFRVDALSSDFSDYAPSSLDLLISNPPYVAEEEASQLPPDVFDFEPHTALFAQGDPLVFYRSLAAHGKELLGPCGWLVLETHADFGGEAEQLLVEAGYDSVVLRADYAGHPRILIAQNPRKNGKKHGRRH